MNEPNFHIYTASSPHLSWAKKHWRNIYCMTLDSIFGMNERNGFFLKKLRIVVMVRCKCEKNKVTRKYTSFYYKLYVTILEQAQKV